MPKTPIGCEEAFELTLKNVRRLAPTWRRLAESLDAVAAEDIQAQVDAPSASSSLKDGYALQAEDIAGEAWCRRFGCETVLKVVPDQPAAILAALGEAVETRDVVLTSGGAWSGERDLVKLALEDLGWRMVFHRVRLGPGKGTGMGLVGRCPVFMLPGGPPSNLAGFLKLALLTIPEGVDRIAAGSSVDVEMLS